jgi:hypothetical protein
MPKNETGTEDAGSFAAAVLAAHELAEWYVEGTCERRHDAFVYRFAGLEAFDRTREDVGGFRKVIDAVAACDSEPEDARRQGFCRRSPML